MISTSHAVAGVAGALGLLLVTATLGEGGATPPATLWTHGVIVAILGALLALPEASGESVGRAPRAPFGAFLLFVALTMVGAVVAPYRYAALGFLLELGAFLGVVVIAARCGPGLCRRVSLPLLIGAAFQGVVAIHQRWVEEAARPAGTFLNPNHLAVWLVAALFVGLGCVGPVRSRGQAVLRVALAAPALVAVYLTGSRGAVLGLVAGTAWLVSIAWGRLDRRRRSILVTVAVTVVTLAVVGVAVRSRSLDPFRYHRLRIWEASLGAALERPWTGVGPGQWDAAANNLSFPVEAGPLRFERFVDSTHSDLVRLPAELGWPATVAALAALVLALREVRRGRRDGTLGPSTDGAIAALVALGVHAVVDNPSARPALFLLAAALLGSLSSEPHVRRARTGIAWRLGALALLATVFAVGDGSPFLAWKLQTGLPRGRLDAEQRAALEDALAHNPLHPDLCLRQAQDVAGDGRDWGIDDYAAARDAAEKAVRLQPADARYRLGLARVEGLAFGTIFGDLSSRERAAEHYRQAQRLARHDPGIALEEGEFLLRAADPLGARRAAERALAIEPNGLPARLLLAEALLASGTPPAPSRAAALVEEAEAIAERWSDHPRVSPYSRFHLDLDVARVAGIRRRIEGDAATSRTPGDPEGPS